MKLTKIQKIILGILLIIIFGLLVLFFQLKTNIELDKREDRDIPINSNLYISRNNSFFLKNFNMFYKYKLAGTEDHKEIIFYDDYGKYIKFFYWKRINGPLTGNTGVLKQISIQEYFNKITSYDYYPEYELGRSVSVIDQFIYDPGYQYSSCNCPEGAFCECYSSIDGAKVTFRRNTNELYRFDPVYTGKTEFYKWIYHFEYNGKDFYGEVNPNKKSK